MKLDSNKRTGWRWRRDFLAPLACCFLGSLGCMNPKPVNGVTLPGEDPTMLAGVTNGVGFKMKDHWYDPFDLLKPDAPPPPAESLTLGAEGFVIDRPPEPGSAEAEMAQAYGDQAGTTVVAEVDGQKLTRALW